MCLYYILENFILKFISNLYSGTSKELSVGGLLAAVKCQIYATNTCINRKNKASNIVIRFISNIFHEC
jgi:hypothetical protein